MPNPRRKDDQDGDQAEEPDRRDSPAPDDGGREPLPLDLWIDRDYPIHPASP
jgi:hypothetical protein